MKFHFLVFTFLTVLFSQTAQAQTFDQTGSAQTVAEDQAAAICSPEAALRVGEWRIRVRGFGILFATASFRCDEN
jgi:hypothetical protein